MNNIQDTLLFPVRDDEARKQFLIACAVMLAGFIIPILPMLILMGYSAKIMRQIIEDREDPSMPAWQSNDISEMLIDGLRLWGTQLVLMLPLLILMACGMAFLFGGSFSIAALSENNKDSIAPVSMLLFMMGWLFIGLFGVLSLPYGILVSAALPHVVIRRSFQAAFEFNEWFTIFRKALGQFILGYLLVMAASFILVLIMQIVMITIVLICILPLLMIPWMAYQTLIMNTVFAQAYSLGRDQWELASHATT